MIYAIASTLKQNLNWLRGLIQSMPLPTNIDECLMHLELLKQHVRIMTEHIKSLLDAELEAYMAAGNSAICEMSD